MNSKSRSAPSPSESKNGSRSGVRALFEGKKMENTSTSKRSGAEPKTDATRQNKGRFTWSLPNLFPKTPPQFKQIARKLLGWLLISLRIGGRIVLLPFHNTFARYAALLTGALLLLGLALLLQELPSPRKLTSSENYAVSTQIFDRNGELLYEIFADENRTPIELEDLPPHILQATIAIEDKNFYRHFGFDIQGILRAGINNAQGKRLEGGSTITQQLVKNALLTSERSLTRKAKEGVLAILTEIFYSKDDILEMYLNYIPYGGTAVGIEAASRQYFDKSAKDLTLAEASLLAGLPQAPSTYSPFASNPQRSQHRQAEVLRRMAEEKYITPEEAEGAKNQVLTFALSKTDIQAPHFVFFVRDFLYEKYGVETVEKGGLRVHTSLDLQLQNVALASLSAEIDKLQRYRVSNGAGLILKPNTGEILAMMGSKDYFDSEIDGQVNVALQSRQPGSSIKPLMYATAFQNKKLQPGSLLLDIPTCFKVTGQKDYCPKNYDNSFKGPVTVRRSLGNSLNIPAVKGLYTIGLLDFIDQATDMGITSWVDPSRYGLSLTLGGGEVRMLDLAQAFGVLATGGVKVPLTPILKIEDFRGNVLEEINLDKRLDDLRHLTEFDDESSKGELKRVMDRAPAYMTAHIMQDNDARREAFGSRSELVIPNQVVSAKTGTTNDLKDNWTIGFTPEFLVVTWVGNNDGSPMNQSLVSGVTGAAPIWNDIMSYVLQGREPAWPERPRDVVEASVCSNGMPPGSTSSGSSPQSRQNSGNKKNNDNRNDNQKPVESNTPTSSNNSCGPQHNELYWKLGRPSNSKVLTQEIWIKPDTGLPPAPGEQADGLVLETHTIYADPVTEYYCMDCRRATDEEGKTVQEQYSVQVNFASTNQEEEE